MRMQGFINFSEPGTYGLQFLSNDGVELFIGEELTISDPKQHSDQLSEKAIVSISKAGWYPVRIDYFQRKGTAALKFFWATPGITQMQPLPASVYAHQP